MVSAIIKDHGIKDWICHNLKEISQVMKDQFSETINYSDYQKLKRIIEYNSNYQRDDSNKSEQKVHDDSEISNK